MGYFFLTLRFGHSNSLENRAISEKQETAMFGKLWNEFKAFAFQGNMIELAVAVVIGGAFGTVIHSLVDDVIMPTVGYVINTGEMAAQKAKEAAETVANKAGIATSQPTTAATTQPTDAANTAATPPAAPATPAVVTPNEGRQRVLALVEAGKISADDGAKLIGAMASATPAPAPTPTPAVAKPTEPVKIDLMIGPVPVGKFIGALVNFIIVALAVFLMIVKLLGGVMKKIQGPDKPGEPTTRECPECLSIIPIKAKRCSHCSAVVPPVDAAPATA
jgi:large-conductance mechanosensitive channel